MYGQNDPRISPIAHYFSANRTSISTAIQHLIELKYLRKNAGHGHPLRPAYALTAKGMDVAAWATELDNVLETAEWKIARRSWTLPILREISPESRFSELRSKLSPVTDRALSETLKTLGQKHWINRYVDADHSPPSVTYTPLGTGEILVPVLLESLSV